MQSEQIRALIEEGKAIERRSPMLRQAVINLATTNGRRVTELEVQKVINFISEYIEHAPAMMRLIELTAAKLGAQRHVQPILDVAEHYFLAADDVIPDKLGLVGLLDDAYLTHCLLQKISERYEAQFGRSLMPFDMRSDNAFVRRLIGEPFVDMLEDRVSATLDGLSTERDLNEMLAALGQLNLSSIPDPIWGHARASEIPDARLRVTGVF